MHKEYYFEVHESVKKIAQPYWTRIKSRNGKIVWISEMYKSEQGAVRPVRKLIQFIGKKKCSLKFYKGGKALRKEIL